MLRIGTCTLMEAVHLRSSLRIGATGSHVPYSSPIQAHAAFMPSVIQPELRCLLDSFPDHDFAPVSTL